MYTFWKIKKWTSRCQITQNPKLSFSCWAHSNADPWTPSLPYKSKVPSPCSHGRHARTTSTYNYLLTFTLWFELWCDWCEIPTYWVLKCLFQCVDRFSNNFLNNFALLCLIIIPSKSYIHYYQTAGVLITGNLRHHIVRSNGIETLGVRLRTLQTSDVKTTLHPSWRTRFLRSYLRII